MTIPLCLFSNMRECVVSKPPCSSVFPLGFIFYIFFLYEYAKKTLFYSGEPAASHISLDCHRSFSFSSSFFFESFCVLWLIEKGQLLCLLALLSFPLLCLLHCLHSLAFLLSLLVFGIFSTSLPLGALALFPVTIFWQQRPFFFLFSFYFLC